MKSEVKRLNTYLEHLYYRLSVQSSEVTPKQESLKDFLVREIRKTEAKIKKLEGV